MDNLTDVHIITTLLSVITVGVSISTALNLYFLKQLLSLSQRVTTCEDKFGVITENLRELQRNIRFSQFS